MEGKYHICKGCVEMGIEGLIYIDGQLMEKKGPAHFFKSEVFESKGWFGIRKEVPHL